MVRGVREVSLVGLGALTPRHAAAPVVPAPWVIAAEQFGEPLATLPVAVGREQRTNRSYLAAEALSVWACGFAAVAIFWLIRWRRVAPLRRSAPPTSIEFPVPVMFASGLVEPGIFGIFRPALLLPQGIGERLTPARLDAILAHELCHVRRKDNLTAAIHMAVRRSSGSIRWCGGLGLA